MAHDEAEVGTGDGAEDASPETAATAVAEGAGRRADRRVLVPIDGSPQSSEALEYALAEYPEATVVLLHVIDPIEAGYATGPGPPGTGQEWYEDELDAAEALFEEARALPGGADVEFETVTELGRPAQRIVAAAEEADADLVVMGSHGRSGVTRILLGSVAETVVRRSPVPVTIIR